TYLAHQLVGAPGLFLPLAANGKIETPGELGNSRGSAANRCIHRAALHRYARFLCARLEALNGTCCELAALFALHLDQFDWNTAKHSVGNDGVVNEGNADDMRSERCSGRDRIIACKILFASAGKVDH